MTAALNQHAALAEATSRRRRALGAASPRAFALAYLDRHLKAPPSRMHIELFDRLEALATDRGSRLAVAAPRGHAKTTLVSLAYVLWCLLYRKEMFILVVSATSEQAQQLLADLTRELRGNRRLIEDFPEVCLPLIKGRGAASDRLATIDGPAGATSGGVKVTRHHLVLPNGTAVRVLGAGQGVRGMKQGAHRPSLIIGDDLEELEATLSDEQRDKTLDWFQKTLLKTGDARTNVVVIGTVLHYDSLLANLTRPDPQRGKAGGWEGRVYRAVEAFSDRPELWERWEQVRFGELEFEGASGPDASERFFEANRAAMLTGTKVLWPEVEPYEMLMAIRADEGTSSFQSEKQNEPLDPEQCLFNPDKFSFWDDPSGGDDFADATELLRKLGRDARVIGACDPSLGERGRRGDYSAIITLVKDDRSGRVYVIGADIARRTPDQLLEAIVALHRSYDYERFGMETNLHRGLLAAQLDERATVAGRWLDVEPIENTRNKVARVSAIEPLVTQGRVRFSRQHQVLLEQLRQFPLGAHDDGPDALEMAVRLAEEPQHFTVVTDL